MNIYQTFQEYKKVTSSQAREIIDGNYILKNGIEKRGFHSYTSDGYIIEFGKTAAEAIKQMNLIIEITKYNEQNS